jgi:hypothetical protein
LSLILESDTPSATIKITRARMTSRCGMISAPAMSSSTMRSAGSNTISTGGAFDLAFTLQVGSRPDRGIQFSADHLLAVGCT